MDIVVVASQVIIAVGLLNVWLLRTDKATEWRGGDARSMREEFAAYGLPAWSMWVVGSIKVFFAILLIVGIWVTPVVQPAAIGIAILMVGAIVMHFKVGDPPKKSLPAFAILVLCLIVIFFSA